MHDPQPSSHPAEFNRKRGVAVSSPKTAEKWCALADKLKHHNQLSEALEAYTTALTLQPHSFKALEGIAVIFHKQNRFADALSYYQKCLVIHPKDVITWNNSGSALSGLGQHARAMDCFQRAIALDPAYAYSYRNLGRAHQSMGAFAEAVAAFKQALALKPDFEEAFSSLLFCLSHLPSTDPTASYLAHRAFGERFEPPLRQKCRQHTNTPDSSRPLHLGFVSADLYNHAVAHFIEPIWEAINRDEFEIRVYANRAHRDETTERLEKLVDAWETVSNWSDDVLAERIRSDRVDILFDLSGHTPLNRLLVFARKPAPIQFSWIGYPNTTGMTSIDYRIVDRFVAPPGMMDRYFTETLLYVPSAGTFKPAATAPPVNPLPALKRGYLTFGSFNRIIKLSKEVIPLWSRVLSAIPGSRLLVGSMDDPVLKDKLIEHFGRCGIAADRLDFRPKRPLPEYLALHHDVDMMLDTFPYTSGTIANHALWMGVPTITLAGSTMPQRLSAAHLGRVGLEEWITESADEYVAKARYWATHLDELALLRSGLRDKVQNSPYRQPATVVRGIESALRQVWEKWCKEQTDDPGHV
jgi:protein O-GlcNAc transferase